METQTRNGHSTHQHKGSCDQDQTIWPLRKSVQGFEKREIQGSITLKNLREVAQSLNMKLVYGFVPKSGSLERMIEDQAFAVARKIVMRTDTTIKLEDQGITSERRDKAILELAEEIKRKMPRYLWD